MLGRQISACPFFQNIFNHIEVSSKDLEIVFLIFEKKKNSFFKYIGCVYICYSVRNQFCFNI